MIDNQKIGAMQVPSKKELIGWASTILKRKVSHIEELANGSHFCQLLFILTNGKVPLSKVNYFAKLEYENLHNLTVLTHAIMKNNIPREVDISRIAKGTVIEILDLLQWFNRSMGKMTGDILPPIPMTTKTTSNPKLSESYTSFNKTRSTSIEPNKREKSFNYRKSVNVFPPEAEKKQLKKFSLAGRNNPKSQLSGRQLAAKTQGKPQQQSLLSDGDGGIAKQSVNIETPASAQEKSQMTCVQDTAELKMNIEPQKSSLTAKAKTSTKKLTSSKKSHFFEDKHLQPKRSEGMFKIVVQNEPNSSKTEKLETKVLRSNVLKFGQVKPPLPLLLREAKNSKNSKGSLQPIPNDQENSDCNIEQTKEMYIEKSDSKHATPHALDDSSEELPQLTGESIQEISRQRRLTLMNSMPDYSTKQDEQKLDESSYKMNLRNTINYFHGTTSMASKDKFSLSEKLKPSQQPLQ